MKLIFEQTIIYLNSHFIISNNIVTNNIVIAPSINHDIIMSMVQRSVERKYSEMADVFNKSDRSKVMQKIRSNNNKSTELKLIKLFKEHHIVGWRRHYNVKGHPDFVFPQQRVAIFVDGCFWHGHNCRNLTPKDNSDYWDKKRAYNKKHDAEMTALFEARGWTVLRIWECELKKKNIHETLNKIKKATKKENE